MNRLLQAAAALVCAAGLSAFASTSNVTATLTDSDGTAWANCAWSAVVSSPTPPTISGVPVPDAQLRANGSCNGSGTLSATMLDTSSVDQRGVTWTFTITPNASVQPSVVSGVAVSGASVNLSTNLSSGIKAPRFNPGPKAYGYADAEVNAPTLGDTYFNTAGVCGSASLRQYSNAGWQCGSTVPPAPLTVTSGLTALYKFTEPSGTAPVDYSGSGNDATLPGGVNNPTASTQGLTYSATQAQWFTLPASVSSTGRTYLALLCQPALNVRAASQNGWGNSALIASASSGGPLAMLFGYANNSGGAWTQGMGANALSGPLSFRATYSNAMGRGCAVYHWVFSSTADRLGMDGTDSKVSVQGASGSAVGSGGLINVGYSSVLTSGGFYGTIRDMAVFNRELTASEVQSVSASLWSIGRGLGLAYPLKPQATSDDQFVCLGDSITNGQGVTNSYCSTAVMSALTGSPTITNTAVSGAAMRYIYGRGQQTFAPIFASNAQRNTASLFACTNDIALNSDTPATCFNNTLTTLRELRSGDLPSGNSASPWKTILIPMLSRTGQDTNKDTLDALYTANWQRISDAYVAPSDPQLWADGASANTSCFQDGTHPTQTCQNAIGAYVQNAYNKLYGSTASNPNTTSAATYTIAAADGYLKADNSAADQTLTLPSCKGYSTGFTIYTLTSAHTVTLKTAASSETINGTDYSSTGMTLAGSSVITIQPVWTAPATATCAWIVGK